MSHESLMTPLILDVLLHHHTRSIAFPNHENTMISDAHSYLIQHGMIDTSTVHIHHVTSKGEAFIKHLMNIPFPKQAWIIEGETYASADNR